METPLRSLAKSITWRIVGITVLFLVALTFGVGVRTSLEITFVTHGVKFVVNFYHERAWNRVEWGRERAE